MHPFLLLIRIEFFLFRENHFPKESYAYTIKSYEKEVSM